MTVAEMIARLQALPPDAEVVVAYYESDWHPACAVELRPAFDQPKRAYRGAIWLGPSADEPPDWQADDIEDRGATARAPVVVVACTPPAEWAP